MYVKSQIIDNLFGLSGPSRVPSDDLAIRVVTITRELGEPPLHSHLSHVEPIVKAGKARILSDAKVYPILERVIVICDKFQLDLLRLLEKIKGFATYIYTYSGVQSILYLVCDYNPLGSQPLLPGTAHLHQAHLYVEPARSQLCLIRYLAM